MVRLEIGVMLLVALVGLGMSSLADEGSYGCEVLAGTEMQAPSIGVLGVSATSPAGGIGECHIHTLEERSQLTEVNAPDGCEIYVDTDDDDFVENTAVVTEVYESGTSFIAFCDAGVALVENEISVAPPPPPPEEDATSSNATSKPSSNTTSES